MRHQKTLKKEISFSGVGLHTGKEITLTLKPAPAGTGIVFCAGGVFIPARFPYARCGQHYSLLQKGGARVHTVEHLLSALYAAGVSNCVAALQGGNEVPFFDGSSREFSRALMKTGFRVQNEIQRMIKLKKPVIIQNENKLLAALPASSLKVFYLLEHNHPLIGTQSFMLETFAPARYLKEVSPARTFATIEEAEMLVKSGLARGGSMSSAVLVGGKRSSPLRFKNEFARHKCLDLLGDLALIGMPLEAHIVALRTGHYENHLLAAKLSRKKIAGK